MAAGPKFFVIGLLPVALFTILCGLEVMVSLLQAYVIVVLTVSYLNDAINLH